MNDGQKSAQSAGSNVATASLAGLQNSLNMISALMNSGLDTSPTITPVIDDSQVRAGIQRVNTMMTNLTVGPEHGYGWCIVRNKSKWRYF